MAKREMSNTLKNLKFMQRAAQREEKTKKQEEEEKPDGNFFSAGTVRKCVVIMEGDPHPGATIGRMSFQSFNPSVDKLNKAAGNVCRPESTATNSTPPSGKSSSRGNRLSLDGAECSNIDSDGDLKRKQSDVSSESQNRGKSPKSEGGQNSKGTFKRPKHDKLDWSLLRPKSQNKRN